MDTEGLSLICAGLGIAEEDDSGNRIGYSKGQYCLGTPQKFKIFFWSSCPLLFAFSSSIQTSWMIALGIVFNSF